ncbi:MAG: hypothetical protein Q7S12_01575 [bacterium]|nr:hypothetical protein [bacterium]
MDFVKGMSLVLFILGGALSVLVSIKNNQFMLAATIIVVMFAVVLLICDWDKVSAKLRRH